MSAPSILGQLIASEIHSKAAKHLSINQLNFFASASNSSSSPTTTTNSTTKTFDKSIIDTSFHTVLVGLSVFPKDIQSHVIYQHFQRYVTSTKTSTNNKLHLIIVCGGNSSNSNNSNSNSDGGGGGDSSATAASSDPVSREAQMFNEHTREQFAADYFQSKEDNEEKVNLPRLATAICGTTDQRIDAYTKITQNVLDFNKNMKNDADDDNDADDADAVTTVKRRQRIPFVGVISSKFFVADVLHKRISLLLVGGVVFVNSHRASSIERFALSLLQPRDTFEESALSEMLSLEMIMMMSSNNNNNKQPLLQQHRQSPSSPSFNCNSIRWGLCLTESIASTTKQHLSTLNVVQTQLFPRVRICIDDWLTKHTAHSPSIIEDFVALDDSTAALLATIRTVFKELVMELNRSVVANADRFDSVRLILELLGNTAAASGPIEHSKTPATTFRNHQSTVINAAPPQLVSADSLISPLAFHLLKKVVRNLPPASRFRDVCESLLHVRRMLKLATRLDSGTFLAVLECLAAEAFYTRTSQSPFSSSSSASASHVANLQDSLLWLASPSTAKLLNSARDRAFTTSTKAPNTASSSSSNNTSVTLQVPTIYHRVRQLLARIIARAPPALPIANHPHSHLSRIKRSVVLIVVPQRNDLGATVLDDVRMSVTLNTLDDVRRAMVRRFFKRFFGHLDDVTGERSRNDQFAKMKNQEEQQKQQQEQQEPLKRRIEDAFVNDGDDLMVVFKSLKQESGDADGKRNNKNGNSAKTTRLNTNNDDSSFSDDDHDELIKDGDDDDDDDDTENGDRNKKKNQSTNFKKSNTNSSNNNNKVCSTQIPMAPLGMVSKDLKQTFIDQEKDNFLMMMTQQNDGAPTQESDDSRESTIQKMLSQETLLRISQHHPEQPLQQQQQEPKEEMVKPQKLNTSIIKNPEVRNTTATEKRLFGDDKKPTMNPKPRHSIVDVDAMSLSSDDDDVDNNDDDDDEIKIIGEIDRGINNSTKLNLTTDHHQDKTSFHHQQNHQPPPPVPQQLSKRLIDPECSNAQQLQLYSDERITSLPSFQQRLAATLHNTNNTKSGNNNDDDSHHQFSYTSSASSSSHATPLHQFVRTPQNLPKEEGWKFTLHDEGIDVVCVTLNSVTMSLLRECLDPDEYQKSRQIFCLDVNLQFLRTLEMYQAEEGMMKMKNNNNSSKNNKNNNEARKLHVRIIAEQGSACHEDVLHEIEEERNAIKRVSFYARTHTPRLVYRSMGQTLMTSASIQQILSDDGNDGDLGGTTMTSSLMDITQQTFGKHEKYAINNNNNNINSNPNNKNDYHSTYATTSSVPTILVDDRELRAELPLWLHEVGGNLKIIPLTLIRGDYILSKDMAVERKAVGDLVGSLKSGRLNNQLSQLQAFFRYSVILIELTNGHGATPALTADFGGGYNNQGHKENLAKMILNKNPAFSGNNNQQQQQPRQICVVWSTGPVHSAKLLLRMKNLLGQRNNEPDASDPAMITNNEATTASSSSSRTLTGKGRKKSNGAATKEHEDHKQLNNEDDAGTSTMMMMMMMMNNNNNSDDNGTATTTLKKTTTGGGVGKMSQIYSEAACEMFHRLPGCAFINVNKMVAASNKKNINNTIIDTADNLNNDEQQSPAVNNLASLVRCDRKRLEEVFGGGGANNAAAAQELFQFLHTPLNAPIEL